MDLLTKHLEEMRTMNAARKSVTIGSPSKRRLDLVIESRAGEFCITNRLTGTTAREHDAEARAALLVECEAGLVCYEDIVEALREDGATPGSEVPTP